MRDLIIQILSSTIIVSSLLSALIFLSRNLILERLKNAVKHDYDKKLKEYENELNTRTQTQMAKLTSQLSVELEIAKTKIGPYSERQFDLYNELWASLCDLKYTMLQLWDQASEEKFNQFSKALETTTIRLEKSALVFEEHHYIELIGILNEFANYEIGKRTLIDYRYEQPRASYDQQQTKKMIDDNRATKKRLLNYLPQIMSCLRNQINGKSIAEQEA